MKKIFVLTVAILLVFSGFSQQVNDKKLKKFCQSFAKAIESKDAQKCLQFFDADYVKEQHDSFLSGRTTQFVNEFLLGFSEGAFGVSAEERPSLDKVTSMKFIDVFKDANGSTVAAFDIHLSSGNTFRLMAPVSIKSPKKFGFVGAMG